MRRKRTLFPAEYVADRWVVVDCKGKALGRVASEIAIKLRGKDLAIFCPSLPVGAHVIAINAGEIMLTGNKMAAKLYYRYSGYPGGLRQESAEQLLKRKPTELVALAVRGMLPKNRLSRVLMGKRLKVYAGSEHPHRGQVVEKSEEVSG